MDIFEFYMYNKNGYMRMNGWADGKRRRGEKKFEIQCMKRERELFMQQGVTNEFYWLTH